MENAVGNRACAGPARANDCDRASPGRRRDRSDGSGVGPRRERGDPSRGAE